MSDDHEIPEKPLKEIGNIARDANKAVLIIVFGFIVPIVGLAVPLIGLVRLLQWHYYRKKFPVLCLDTHEDSTFSQICTDFRGARKRFWAMIILNPIVILIVPIMIWLVLATPANVAR